MQANCKSKAMQVWQSPLNFLSMQTCLCVYVLLQLVFYFSISYFWLLFLLVMIMPH